MNPKKQRRKEKKTLRKWARGILWQRYKISNEYTTKYHAICRYIRQVKPELKADGYELLRQFVGSTDYKPTFRGDPTRDAFLESYEWRRVRMEVLKRDGRRCACCGATPSDGIKVHVDHIKPRKLYPFLALDKTNLQVLCEVCNHGKVNWDQTDWREKDELPTEQISHLRSIK